VALLSLLLDQRPHVILSLLIRGNLLLPCFLLRYCTLFCSPLLFQQALAFKFLFSLCLSLCLLCLAFGLSLQCCQALQICPQIRYLCNASGAAAVGKEMLTLLFP